MAETTIEWVRGPNGEKGFTFNPWRGCTPKSPGCNNCYAARDAKRFGLDCYGKGKARIRTSARNWNEPLRWNRQAEKEGIRYRVFCASMADVFDSEAPDGWRRDLFELILKTPHLDWLLLTKRIGNVKRMVSLAFGCISACSDNARLPENVWLGITVCNQEEADRDIPILLDTPAEKRFLSIEPLLGPVDLDAIDMPHTMPENVLTGIGGRDNPTTIDWVIVGGETGPKARPAHPNWVRSLRDQCAAARVPFMFKQWGEWASEKDMLNDGSPGHQTFFSNASMVICASGERVYRVGKARAGRLLDGKEHMEVPA